MDQRRQVRLELDAPVLPWLRGEPGAIAVVCLGLQPGQLPTPFGSAPIYQPLVITYLANQVDQDRREGGAPCPLHLLPNGRGVVVEQSVRGDLETDSTVDSTGAGVTRNERKNEIKDRCNHG